MASLFKSTTTYDPIYALLNAENEKLRDELTEKWRDHKLEELNFVGIVGALFAGVLTSTGSWPTVLPDGTRQPWTVRACWYCGIILALGSVLFAAQQSIRLHRLSCHRDANVNIRRLLRQKHPCRRSGRVLPRQAQVYVWQMSVLLLWLSVMAMLAGMLVLFWSGTRGIPGFGLEWDEDAKLAVTFTTVTGIIMVLFVAEQVTLYSWRGQDDTGADEGERSPLL